MNQTNSLVKEMANSVSFKQVGGLVKVEKNQVCNQAVCMSRKGIEVANVMAALGIGVWKVSQSVDRIKAHPLKTAHVLYALNYIKVLLTLKTGV